MKIEVKGEFNDCVEEGSSVLYRYLKRLYRNPKKDISASYKDKEWLMIILHVYFVLLFLGLIGMIFIEHEDIFTIILNTILFIFLIWVISTYHLARRKLKKSMVQLLSVPYQIMIHKDNLVVERGDDTDTISWDTIGKVAINPHSILFLTNQFGSKSVLIPSEYKESVLKGIKASNHENLVIDYTK